ncbi:MAG: glycosyltransferase [Chitinophagaceae bacterium]|nr:glycosyltransferase [Chitinophagaceae bacterium]
MNSPEKIVIIGPAHPLRGGLASYDERLAREFMHQGFKTTIYTFSLQYPSFLFPGTTQLSSEPAPGDLDIKVCINSVNPFNWLKIGNELKRSKPDIIIVRYWLPFMGPCLGTILRKVKKNKHTKVVCIADNIIPHEKRPGDTAFTKYFLNPVDAFITMSEKVLSELLIVANVKPAKFIAHPLYDNFGDKISKTDARKKLNIDPNDRIILFFGFIRKYKGLDLLLEAMKILSPSETLHEENAYNHSPARIKLLIAGEFYEDKKKYTDLINTLGIKDELILHTDFIPDSEVKYYLCAADCVVQPYRRATQSGVTPLAYHFEVPMIVTNVGGLPSLVPDKKVGLVAEPNPDDIARKIIEFFQLGADYFLPHLREEKNKYSWSHMVDAIIKLVN